MEQLLWVPVSESVIPTAEPSRQAGNLANYDAELCVQLQNELKFTHAHLITSKNFRRLYLRTPLQGKGEGEEGEKKEI
jgi:hypothetical protein